MTFLNPWSALVAASVAVPLLLLLYLLRLRRQPLRIASTLLWQHATEELEVNAPFRRLRWSLLLLLQLLLLVVLLLALGRPVLQSSGRPASRVILLIDRSASMNATDAGGRTRLEAARHAAARIVERLGRASRRTRMMVIAFGASARVVSGFESNRAALLGAIDSIGPTDEEADLESALRLASAFTRPGEDETDEPPEVVVISDGGVGEPADSAGFSLRRGTFRYVAVGPPAPTPVRNVGLVSLSARRDYDDPGRVLVFSRLLNAGPEPVETVVTLLIDGKPAASKRVQIAPAEERPGESVVTFAIDLHASAVLSVHHNRRDDLEADDRAALVMPDPRRPRIALVHPGGEPDPFLHELLAALEPDQLKVLSARAYDAYDPREIDSGAVFDLVVFDRVGPRRLPGIATLTVGAVPAGITATEPSDPGGRRILSWQRQHPVMRHVSLDTVAYAGFGGLNLPAGATALAEGPQGPLIGLVVTRGARHLVVGFELQRSNWPLQVSSTVFMQNAVAYLTLAVSGQNGLAARPGEPITVRALPSSETLSIEGPLRATIDVQPGAATTLPVLRRVGLYTVRGAAPPMDRIAVSMLSDAETDIRPRAAIVVNAEAAVGGSVGEVAPLELWPWLVGIGFGLLVLEWLVYCRRMRG